MRETDRQTDRKRERESFDLLLVVGIEQTHLEKLLFIEFLAVCLARVKALQHW